MNATVHFVDGLAFRPAPLIRCAMCRDLLYPEDFRPDLFREDAVAALHEKHGPNCCTNCIDDAGKNTPTEDEWL